MKNYSVTVKFKLDRPIEDFGRRDLRKHIATAIERWGKSGDPEDPFTNGILEVEVSAIKDHEEMRSHGGRARAEALTQRQRTKIARKAANARWEKEKNEKS